MTYFQSDMGSKAADKRRRLVDAARDVIYREGFANTTLAKVSEASGVPLGNVYYYFKTKEQLAGAVLDGRLAEVEEMLNVASEKPEPTLRLQAFLALNSNAGQQVAQYGCPYGSLTVELEKADCGASAALAERARRLIERQVEWVTEQFGALGSGDPRERALELISAMQGAALVSHSLGDGDILKRRLQALSAALASSAN